ncbi:MAG TPA: pantoate--beta-alanine ligase [Nitrospirales bacterium]|nr:pantoate--beta-alanine ligase [Nitrospirales bacterium]
MKVIKTISAMQKYSTHCRKISRSIGFVPTMGALHDGHRALIKADRHTNRIVVVSLFVNPLQFGPREDFQQYPRTLTQDRLFCEKAGADILFVPNGHAMYPDGFQTTVLVGKVTQGYEGQSRPAHFDGVTTVVTKLCHIVAPDRVYFGQKDYQQAIAVKQMLLDLNMPIKMVMRPTVRESDGLAMSSRNTHLKPNERGPATVIYHALKEGGRQIRLGERSGARIRGAIERVLNTEAVVNVDYVGIMHPDTLEEMKKLTGRVVLAIAVYIGKTRLIDNVIVRVPTL